MLIKLSILFIFLVNHLIALDFNFPVEGRDEVSDHSGWISAWVEIPQFKVNKDKQWIFSLAWDEKQIAQWAMQNPSLGHFTVENNSTETGGTVGIFYKGAPVVLNPSIHIFTKMQFPSDLGDDLEVWQSSVKADVDLNQLHYTDYGLSVHEAVEKAQRDPEVQYFVMQTDGLNPEIGNVAFFKELLPISTGTVGLYYKGPLKRY